MIIPQISKTDACIPPLNLSQMRALYMFRHVDFFVTASFTLICHVLDLFTYSVVYKCVQIVKGVPERDLFSYFDDRA